MQIIPAIDIRDGRCVRLRQGDFNFETVFSDDPLFVAEQWIVQGAKRLHLVDLDGALYGEPVNKKIVKDIVKFCDKIPVQVGGGIRSLDTLNSYLDDGVSYIILGTAAIKSSTFVEEACKRHQKQIIVGLDSRNRKVAIDGWSSTSSFELYEVARNLEKLGINSIIFTDIDKDGMLQGPNIEEIAKLAESLKIPIIASGGVKDLTDIKALANIAHLGEAAVIVGRAIDEGTLNLKVANEFIEKQKI